MTLDEALLFNGQQRSRWLSNLFLICIPGWLTVGFSGGHWILLTSLLCVVLIPITLTACAWEIVDGRRRERYWNALDEAVRRSGSGRYEQAHALCGKYEDAALALWECDEVHIPGDCPLCGAQ